MSKTKRNGNIEILRFIFSIFIVLFHLSGDNTTVYGHTLFCSGYLSVEFFFIIAGVFLGKKLSPNRDIHEKQPLYTSLVESRKYVFSRIASIYPYFFVTIVISELAKILTNTATVVEISLELPNELLFLHTLGFNGDENFIVVMWFLSALFCALFLLYPIVYKKYNIFVKYFAPFVAVFCYGVLLVKFNEVGATSEPVIVISGGIIRAVAGISLGTVINEASERFSKTEISKTGVAFVTLLEFILYFVVFVCITIFDKGVSDGSFILILAFALTITLSKKSLLYGRFDNKICFILGKSSMLIFMNHFIWICLVNKVVPFVTTRWQKLLAVFILTIISSIVSYFGGNLLIKVFAKIKNLLFVKKSDRII